MRQIFHWAVNPNKQTLRLKLATFVCAAKKQEFDNISSHSQCFGPTKACLFSLTARRIKFAERIQLQIINLLALAYLNES